MKFWLSDILALAGLVAIFGGLLFQNTLVAIFGGAAFVIGMIPPVPPEGNSEQI